MVGLALGRESELQQVMDLLQPGVASAVLLHGEAGVGKSWLIEQVVLRCRARGLVLMARGSAAETELPYVALSDLVDGVPRDVLQKALAELPPPQRHALEVVLLLGDEPVGGLEVLAVHRAVLTLLRGLSAEHGLLVVLDDEPWLDRESRAALAFVARRSTWPVLAAARTDVGSEVPDVPELLPRPAVTLALGPLPDAAVVALLRETLGTALHPAARRALLRAAAGNPYVALEMARQLLAHPERWDGVRPLPVPAELGALLQERLAQSTPDVRRFVLAAAASPRPVVAAVAQVAQVDTGQTLAAAEHLVTVHDGLVQPVHPLVAQVALAGASAHDRAQVHRRWAETVDDPVQRARHLALASAHPDPDLAADLESAARTAAARTSPHAAAELWQLAVARTPPEAVEDRRRRLLEQSASDHAVGDLASARAAAEAVLADVPAGPLRARGLLALADAVGQDVTAGRPLLLEALEHAGDDVQLRIRLLGDLGTGHLVAGELDEAQRVLTDAVSAARSSPGPELVSALWALTMTRTMLGEDAGPLLSEVSAAQADHGVATPYLSADVITALLALYADDPLVAAERLERAGAAAGASGEPYDVGGLEVHHVEALVVAGRTREAVAVARRTAEVAEDLGEVPGNTQYALALALATSGRADEARVLAQQGEAASTRVGDVVFAWQCRYVQLWLCLAQGEAGAAAHARAMAEAPLLRAVKDPAVFRWQADAVEALVLDNALDEAEELLTTLETQASRCGRRGQLGAAARSRAVLTAGRGDLEAALELCDSSRQHLGGLCLPVQQGRTALVRGVLLRRLRRRAPAREALEEAVRLLRDVPLWRDRALSALDGLGLGRAEGALTQAERQVAELVADGLSNAETGRALFMSPKTVEAHLSRVYRKLSVPGRAALARALQGTLPMSSRQSRP